MEEAEFLLQKFGLTPNEAKIYWSLCSLGPTSASEIAKKSGVNRTLMYDSLKKLEQKGFVSEVEKDKKKVFRAADAQHLHSLEAERAEEMKKNLNQLTAEIKKIYAKTTAPAASVFTGMEGVKAILSEGLVSVPEGGEIKIFRVRPEIAHKAPVFTSWWHKKRVMKKVVLKAIFDRSQMSVDREKYYEKMPLTEARFLPETYATPIAYHVYGEKVALLSMGEDEVVGIMIESKTMASFFDENFEFIWKNVAKKA